MTDADQDVGDSLRLLAPGVVHLLGNALFRVHGHAQMLPGGDPEVVRERRAIAEAVDKAGEVLQVLRWLLGEAGTGPAQAGILLQRLGDCMRVPLRERGLRLQILHSSRQSPVLVDGQRFSRGVLGALRILCLSAPEGCGGTLRVDLFGQEAERALVRMELQADPELLPFPLDAAACAQRAGAALVGVGVTISPLADAPGLQVEIPCHGRERTQG